MISGLSARSWAVEITADQMSGKNGSQMHRSGREWQQQKNDPRNS